MRVFLRPMPGLPGVRLRRPSGKGAAGPTVFHRKAAFDGGGYLLRRLWKGKRGSAGFLPGMLYPRLRRKKKAAPLREMRGIPLRVLESPYPGGQSQPDSAGPVPQRAIKTDEKRKGGVFMENTAPNLVKVQITQKGETSLREGHPWVYDTEVLLPTQPCEEIGRAHI